MTLYDYLSNPRLLADDLRASAEAAEECANTHERLVAEFPDAARDAVPKHEQYRQTAEKFRVAADAIDPPTGPRWAMTVTDSAPTDATVSPRGKARLATTESNFLLAGYRCCTLLSTPILLLT